LLAFDALGYVACGAAYAVLTVFLLTSYGSRVGAYLVAASFASCLWALFLAIQTWSGFSQPLLLVLAEVARSGTWIIYVAALLAQVGVSTKLRRAAHGVWLGVASLAVIAALGSNWFGTPWQPESLLIPGGIALALTGLVLLEQLFRNSLRGSRSAIKPLVVGLGGLFAYDFFMYSRGLLIDDLAATATWSARGVVNLLIVPLIAEAVRRNPDWRPRIYFSRQVVFYTATLVAVGAYLLAISFGGFLIVRFGGSWGAFVQIVFLAGAALLLAVLLFSGALRTWLRVFLSKHFFQNKYDYREEWLRLVSTLSEFDDSSTREVVIKAMAQIVASPSGHLWVSEPESGVYRLAASYRTEAKHADIGADDALIRFMLTDRWLVDLREYDEDPSRYGQLMLPDWLGSFANAWLLVPLFHRQEMLGVIMLNAAPIRRVLNYEDRDLLKTVGNHIAVHLAQERSSRMLAEAHQFEAYNRLTAFLMHDLKNVVAQQALIVSNAKKHKRNPDFVDDAIETIGKSVQRVRRVIEQLQQRSEGHLTERIELGKEILNAISRCADRQPAPTARVGEKQVWIRGNRERFQMALLNAIRNAQDATEADGDVTLTLTHDKSGCSVCIVDSGIGMDESFIRERLFKPFDSTKGSTGMGIGAYQLRETVRAMGGEVSVDSEPDKGTRVEFRFSSLEQAGD
jgi:putative PEP-CTERM system histidine kinase